MPCNFYRVRLFPGQYCGLPFITIPLERMERIIGEMAKQAGVPSHVLRDHAGTLISFFVFHSNAFLRPRGLSDKLMVYALIAGIIFGAHAFWVVCMTVLGLVLGDYAVIAHCVLAAGLPTFAITVPVYRFKKHQSQRRQPAVAVATVNSGAGIPARRRPG